MNPLLDIYKASAGSGKTYLLTLKYLSLLFEKPGAYRQILAVTFTNKATSEMKERILKELSLLADGQATGMGQTLVENGIAEDLPGLFAAAKLVYTNILHDYSRFAVSTIDAFTQKMIRSCSWELGIDAGFALQLNAEVVCDDLATRLFAKIDTPGYQPLRKQMAELATERVDNGKGWDFKQELVDMAKMLFSESYLDFEARLFKEKVDAEEAMKELAKAVNIAIPSMEKDWHGLAENGQEILLNHGLTANDFSRKASGIGGRFDAAFNKIESPVSNGWTKKVLVEGDAPYAKTTPAGLKTRIDSAMPEITTALLAMDDFYKKEMPRYYTAKAIRSNLNYLRLVVLMGRELAAWRKENNALLISDTHNLLRQLSAETTPEFIYEKIGNRLTHFLMDEFQDTSDFQYHNFKPLLQNSMGQGFYNLVVGDVKQAIYRWRNGDWQLLNSRLPADFAPFLPTANTLVFNYRSTKPIIRFNNFLFTVLPQLLQQHMLKALEDTPEDIRQYLLDTYQTLLTDAYSDSRQSIPDNSPPQGQVSIRFIDKNETGGEEEEDEEEALNFFGKIIRQVHQTIVGLLVEGFQPGDIAILCRTNVQAKNTIETLMVYQQQQDGTAYPLLSADALRISTNMAVQWIIAAMQWLVNEDNRLAETMLRQYQARSQSGMESVHAVFRKQNQPGEGLPPELFLQKEKLRALPVPELINEVITLLKLQHLPEDQPYLLALLDLVHDWVKYADEGVAAFLEYWEEEGIGKSLPAPAGANAVEVVTIHKSKGLAYTIVLMPFCDWNLEPDAKKRIQLWPEMKNTSFPQMPMLPLYYQKDLAKSEVAPYYFAEMANSYMDNLNLLYVALTRTRSRMILWAPLPVNAKGEFQHSKLKTIGHLLYTAGVNYPGDEDGLLNDGFEEGMTLWEYGTPAPPALSKKEPPSPAPEMVFSSWRNSRKTVLRTLEPQSEKQPVELARSKGLLLHEMLSKITSTGGVQKVVRQMEAMGKIASGKSGEYQSILTALIGLAPFEGWEKGLLQRLSERAMVLPGGELRRPDLILYNEMETRVIDFKFTETQEKQHVEQVQLYMQWLRAMHFPEVSGFLVYGFTKEVVPC